MPKQQKMPADPNRRAKATMDVVDAILNGEKPAKDPERVERGKLGGSKGGTARAAKLTPERRSEMQGRPPPLDGGSLQIHNPRV